MTINCSGRVIRPQTPLRDFTNYEASIYQQLDPFFATQVSGGSVWEVFNWMAVGLDSRVHVVVEVAYVLRISVLSGGSISKLGTKFLSRSQQSKLPVKDTHQIGSS